MKKIAITVINIAVLYCQVQSFYVLDPVVITGTRTSLFVRIPQVAEIENRISVSDALKNILFVDQQERGPLGVQADIGIRGSTYQQVLFLLDGVRINDPQTAHHNMDLPVPLSSIERIEVLSGPASSVYGSDAFGGVINIVTGKTEKEKLELKADYGAYNTQNYGLAYENKCGGLSQSVALQRTLSDGYRYDTDFSIYAILSKTALSYNGGEAALSLGFMDKEFGAFDFYTPGRNFPSREWTRTYFASGESKTALGEGVTSVVKANFRKHEDKFMLRLTNLASFNSHTAYTYGGEIALDFGSLVTGISAEQSEIYSTNLGEHRQTKEAVFGEWSGKMQDEFKFNLGMRLENSGWGTVFIPSLATSFSASRELKFTVSAGYSFRGPSFTELYYSDGVSFGNALLKPETAASYDLKAEYAFCRELATTISVYLRNEQNLIDWVGDTPTGKWYANNIGRSDVYGIEANLKADFFSMQTNTGVSLIYAKKDTNYFSKYALNYPSAQISCSVKGPKLFEIVPELEILFKKKTGLNDYSLLNAKLTRTEGSLTVYLEGQNLTNAFYEEITGITQPGITFSTGIKFTI